jgi:hypothetical protein
LNNHLFTRLVGIDTDISALEKATTVCFPTLFDERELKYYKTKDAQMADNITDTQVSFYKMDLTQE